MRKQDPLAGTEREPEPDAIPTPVVTHAGGYTQAAYDFRALRAAIRDVETGRPASQQEARAVLTEISEGMVAPQRTTAAQPRPRPITTTTSSSACCAVGLPGSSGRCLTVIGAGR